jgi:hypothetical protein
VCVFQVELFRLLRRTDPGRQRVAGIGRHVLDAAALDPLIRPQRSFRIHVPGEVAVVAWIGIDEAADRAVLGGDLRLDSSPRGAVPGDDDLPFHVDAELLEPLVVGRNAVVDVDERRGHVAVDRVGVVRRKLTVLLSGGRIARDGRLLQARAETLGLEELEHPLFRRGKEDVERLDRGVESVLAKALEDPARVLLAGGGAQVMRLGGEHAIRLANAGGVRNGAQRLLPVRSLGSGAGGSEEKAEEERGRFQARSHPAEDINCLLGLSRIKSRRWKEAGASRLRTSEGGLREFANAALRESAGPFGPLSLCEAAA